MKRASPCKYFTIVSESHSVMNSTNYMSNLFFSKEFDLPDSFQCHRLVVLDAKLIGKVSTANQEFTTCCHNCRVLVA